MSLNDSDLYSLLKSHRKSPKDGISPEIKRDQTTGISDDKQLNYTNLELFKT